MLCNLCSYNALFVANLVYLVILFDYCTTVHLITLNSDTFIDYLSLLIIHKNYYNLYHFYGKLI